MDGIGTKKICVKACSPVQTAKNDLQTNRIGKESKGKKEKEEKEEKNGINRMTGRQFLLFFFFSCLSLFSAGTIEKCVGYPLGGSFFVSIYTCSAERKSGAGPKEMRRNKDAREEKVHISQRDLTFWGKRGLVCEVHGKF